MDQNQEHLKSMPQISFEEIAKLRNVSFKLDNHPFMVYQYKQNDNIAISKDFREIRFFIDNFPGPKLYYSVSLPIKTMEEFISVCTIAGFDVLPQPQSLIEPQDMQ